MADLSLWFLERTSSRLLLLDVNEPLACLLCPCMNVYECSSDEMVWGVHSEAQ